MTWLEFRTLENTTLTNMNYPEPTFSIHYNFDNDYQSGLFKRMTGKYFDGRLYNNYNEIGGIFDEIVYMKAKL